MVKIRLTRLGDKHTPFYRVIVTDSRVARDGKYIDLLGTYDTLKNPAEIKIDEAKAKDWLAKGAQPTDTAKALLIKAGIIAAPAKRAPAKTGKRPKKEA